MEDELFTIGEVSNYLKIPKSTIYKLSQNAELPSCKIGKQLRFRKSSIDKWITEQEAAATREKTVYAKCILLIDDDKLVLKSVSRFLNMHGYNVEPAESGEEALEKAAKQGIKIDLVITDIRMPGIDGIETIKRLREFHHKHNRASVPEIVITGFADQEVEGEAERLGIRDYIYKPFVTSEFIKTIENRLESIPSTN